MSHQTEKYTKKELEEAAAIAVKALRGKDKAELKRDCVLQVERNRKLKYVCEQLCAAIGMHAAQEYVMTDCLRDGFSIDMEYAAAPLARWIPKSPPREKNELFEFLSGKLASHFTVPGVLSAGEKLAPKKIFKATETLRQDWRASKDWQERMSALFSFVRTAGGFPDFRDKGPMVYVGFSIRKKGENVETCLTCRTQEEKYPLRMRLAQMQEDGFFAGETGCLLGGKARGVWEQWKTA